MELLSKMKKSSYVVLGSAVAVIAALIVGIVSANVIGYAINDFWIVILLSVATVALCAACIYADVSGKEIIGGIASIAAAALVILSIIIIATGRADLFMYVFVYAGPAEVTGFATGVASLALYVISLIGLAVSSFME